MMMMMMSERVHDFSETYITLNADVRRVMARCVCAMQDVQAEENYAAMLDRIVGSDDAAAGCKYGFLAAISTDPREVIERAIMGADVMRTAIRTKH